MAEVKTIGLDIAKAVFQVHGTDASGEAVFARRLRRGQVARFFAQQPRCVVALEACASAHHWHDGGRRHDCERPDASIDENPCGAGAIHTWFPARPRAYDPRASVRAALSLGRDDGLPISSHARRRESRSLILLGSLSFCKSQSPR
jgi:hypothetical protein